jgi:hypothetical protein
MKDVQNFINDLIIEFTASICVKHLDAIQVGMNCRKGIKYKLRIFMYSGTVAYDFPVEKVNKQAYIVPLVINPYIGQIAYNGAYSGCSLNWRFSKFGISASLTDPL